MRFIFVLAALLLPAEAQVHEIGLTLGELVSQHRTGLTIGKGVALQANYGHRLLEWRFASLYGEVHLLANPQRQVASSNLSLTRDVATLYVTPGARLKFRPHGPISPFVVAGGGYALFEQSTTLLSGASNPAPREINRGVFDYGGGVDLRGWKWVGFRAEVRDFYSGSPAYNLPFASGGQHNVVLGGGFLLHFK